jgi:hypothetical protein
MAKKCSTQQLSHCPPILTIPAEWFITIASFMDVKSQFTLAHTCKTLYEYHKNQCIEQKFTLLCNIEFKEVNIYKCFKALGRHMSQTGWVTVKVTFEITLVKPQNNYEHSVKALHLLKSFKLPDGLDCASLNALMMTYPYETQIEPNIFLENFSNLKSFSLCDATINDDIVSMISKLHLLEFISLYDCKWTKDQLEKILKDCTNLQEILLLQCDCPDAVSMKLPPQLKRFKTQHSLEAIDASFCNPLSYI